MGTNLMKHLDPQKYRLEALSDPGINSIEPKGVIMTFPFGRGEGETVGGVPDAI
jgi:hypothetical protein